MNLFIDNTGLHSAARCLEGRANGDSDLKGLLQLAVQLVFSEAIFISGFSPASVIERTNSIRDRLIDCGLSQDGFRIIDSEVLDYVKTCELAARKAADDLAIAFHLEDREFPTDGPDLTTDERRVQIDDFHDCVVHKFSDDRRMEYADRAIEHKGAAAPAYMLAVSEELWTAVRRKVEKEGSWSKGDSTQLSKFLRVYHNDVLSQFLGTESSGKRISAYYSPSVERARALRYRNATLLQRLGETADKTVRNIVARPLALPSLQEGLVQRSGGDPKTLLQEAIRLREQAQSFLPWLTKIEGIYKGGSSDDQLRGSQELHDLTSVLSRSLGSPIRMVDAFDITFDFGIPMPSLSGRKLFEWIQFRKKSRRISVLTELSKDAAYPVDRLAFERLKKSCTESVKR